MIEIEDFKRKETFYRYNNFDNPFIIMTIPVKVTNLVEYCKKNKHFYALFGFLLSQTVNELESFKWRYIDDKFYLCEKVGVSYTEKVADDVVYFDCYEDDLDKYIDEYDKKRKIVLDTQKSISEEKNDVIWVSCEPWFNFSSLVPPFDKSITIPQFIWDRYIEKDGEYYCNLMIMVHHGFVDGQHISEFLKKLEEKISKLK